jgi:hypothetical protein
MSDREHFPFEGLDFVYMPSTDVAGDVEYFTGVLGARLEFAIEAFRTRVAMVRLTEEPPSLLFADHLAGERPILVYRVADLDVALAELEARRCAIGDRFGIPHGPGCTLTTPSGHRLAIYELMRPGAAEHLAGRRDF